MRINLTNRVDEVYSKGILRLPKPWMNKKVCCPIAQFRPWLLENICKGQMITSDCKFHAPLPSYSSHSRPQINGAKIMEYIHPSIYAPQNENAIIEGHLWFSARMSEMTFLDQNIQCQGCCNLGHCFALNLIWWLIRHHMGKAHCCAIFICNF